MTWRSKERGAKMKELFEVKNDGVLRVEEGRVYCVYAPSLKRRIYMDNNGDEIKDYERPELDERESVIIADPDFFKEIGEGFYAYTTHEVQYDMDGSYGLFGIKHINDKKLTEEIYYQIGHFSNGLCSVRLKDTDWGCIDTNGDLVIPYVLSDEVAFNKFGVAVGKHCLIDREGNEIPDTELDLEDDCWENSRYFSFALLNEEQKRMIEMTGSAPDITVDIYDTKTRKYVAKGIPECRLSIYSDETEPEVILAAVKLLDTYENVSVKGKGTIECERAGRCVVYDYYQE